MAGLQNLGSYTRLDHPGRTNSNRDPKSSGQIPSCHGRPTTKKKETGPNNGLKLAHMGRGPLHPITEGAR